MDIFEDTNFKKGLICKVEGCTRGIYNLRLQLCRKHYVNHEYRKKNGVDIRQCKAPDCNKKISFGKTGREYCTNHYYRYIHNLPLDLSIQVDSNNYDHVRGKNNINWNGGTSQYPNHYTMKQMRIKIFKKVNNKCELCGETAKHIHHKDCTKDNHVEDNLIAVCNPCHGVLHSGRKNKSSKYKKMYGFTLRGLSEEYNITAPRLRSLHRRKELSEHIDAIKKNNNLMKYLDKRKVM